VAEWLSGPFRKVVCKVTDAEFESALGGADVAIAFKPPAEWPEAFRGFHLYR
jgi:hypothetical protein